MFAQIARQIVERYYLEPGETVVRVSPRGPAVIVATDRWQWRVGLFDGWPEVVKSDGYALYEVRRHIAVRPPPRPDGVALLPDGRMFHLRADDEFRAFFRRVRELICPLELAALLSRYQGKGPHLERHQNLIVRQEDLTSLLPVDRIETIADFTVFHSVTNKGVWRLDFCTCFIAQEPPDNIYRVGLNRWHVVAGIQGELQWAVRLLARGLDSPRYAVPRSREEGRVCDRCQS